MHPGLLAIICNGIIRKRKGRYAFRTQGTLVIPCCNTKMLKHFALYRGSALWNAVIGSDRCIAGVHIRDLEDILRDNDKFNVLNSYFSTSSSISFTNNDFIGY